MHQKSLKSVNFWQSYLKNNKCSAVAEMGDRGHNRHEPKIGGALSLFGEGSWVPSNTMSRGPRPTSIPSGILIHPAILPQQIWAKNGGGLWPFGEDGDGSPSNTMWPGPRPTCTPSFILIHPTVWLQYTNVTDRIDRQDRTTVWYSIRRTLLQTVAQKGGRFIWHTVYKHAETYGTGTFATVGSFDYCNL